MHNKALSCIVTTIGALTAIPVGYFTLRVVIGIWGVMIADIKEIIAKWKER